MTDQPNQPDQMPEPDLFRDSEAYRRAVTEHLAGATCRHCDLVTVQRRGWGGRRLQELRHEPGCPDDPA